MAILNIIGDKRKRNHSLKGYSAKLLLLLVLLTGIASCNNSGGLSNKSLNESEQVAKLIQVGSNHVTVVDAALIKDTIILPLSYLTEELHIVKLDNSNADYFVTNSSVTISDRHILVSGTWEVPYKLFDKSGRFVTVVGGFGGGPGEYQYIYDTWLDESNNRIYLLPYMDDKILVYDLKGGNLAPIPLSYRTDLFNKLNVNHIDNTIVVLRPPVTTAAFATPFCVWVQNMDGEVINSISTDLYNAGISHEHPFVNMIYNHNNTKQLDIFFRGGEAPVKDTLYHYDVANNELVPKFTVDFQSRNIPHHIYSELPKHYTGYTYEEKINRHPDGGTYRSSENPRFFIVDKTTLKGSYYKLVNDFLGNIEIDRPDRAFSNGYYRVNYEPDSLLEILRNALANNEMPAEMRKKVTDLKNSINDNDNNYIIYAKLKPNKGEG